MVWQAVAAALGEAARTPATSSPARASADGLAYNADGYTVTTGRARATGAPVTRTPGGIDGALASVGGVAATAAANPVPWVVGAVAIVLIAAMMRRRKG